jgi:uncharacterized RDD family membrane protein YckC
VTAFAVDNATLASRGNRLLGQFVDGIIGGVPLFAAAMLGAFIPTVGIVLIALAGAWAAYYYLFADGFGDGQSYAKRWLGMHVVDEKTGAPCSFGQSFVRNLLLAILGPIDWIFSFGEKHQRLGDKAAGTIVIADVD